MNTRTAMYIIVLVIMLMILIILGYQIYSGMNIADNSSIDKCYIVIGGGLAGITTALTIAENNIHHRVIIIEKEKILGGNSAKASSGINGSMTEIQKTKHILDSNDKFFIDTYRSAGNPLVDKEMLIGRLVLRSREAINWLVSHGVDLDDVKMLGGHSHPRTHRNSGEIHIGSYIIGKLVEKVKSTINIIVKTDTTVTDLLSEDNEIVGIVTDKSELIYADSIILTCGGFSFNREMIKKYRPDLENYPTTNGEWALGEGIHISSKIGADLIDMDKIQIHPTAFVDPKDPNNRTKVLAAELLRSIGGILLNSKGNRFCNELGTRAYIVNEMNLSDEDIFYLMIPQKSYYQAEKMIDYYNKKGLLNRMTLEKIEKTYGIKKSALESEIQSYNKHSINRSDQFGKTNYPATPLDTSGEYYVGLVVPAIHYCMGGVAINKDAQVLNIRKEIIPRLYAAGEVTGGVHGDNRLGGNSLLECVVYGKIAGEQVVDIDPSSKTDKKKYITTGPIESDVEHLLLTKAIVAKHNKENDAWMIIHGKVYDVTDILSSHPGGKDSMLPYLGKDASEIFDSIHHASALSQVKLLGIISD